MVYPLFQSFFLGGFECSSHRLRSGKRLDLLAATQHHSYQQIYADYQGLQQQGIFTARSGIRWHLIETRPYHYDFSSVLPALQAAQATGVQILWDLCHFGWPDDLDIFAAEFVRRFASFATAFAHLLANELETIPFLVPMNEISFFAWAGGDAAYLNPFARGRGLELKRQLVRATIAATEAIWAVLPQARILHVDPVINILPDPRRPHEGVLAEQYRLSQYQAWDMLAGRECPELGGQEKYLDIIGVNYYERNQWIHDATFLTPLHPLYKPFRHILREVYDRYRRPLFIAETGGEDEVRPAWLKYIGSEVRAAMRAGVPIEGICLYPILNHPGWDDERHCCNGLWDYADEEGQRELYIPLARELQCQQRLFKQLCAHSIHQRMTVAHTATRGPVPHKKPSLCLFTDSQEPWGLGEQMLTLAAELLNRYRILFVCPPTLRGEHLLACAQALGCTPFALNLQDERTAYRALKARLRRMQVEIFHVQAGSSGEGHQGVDVARSGGVPVVIRTEHLSLLRTDTSQQTAYHALLPALDQIICVSQAVQQSYRTAGVPVAKLALVRPGIYVHQVKMEQRTLCDQWGLPPQAKLVVTVARLTLPKGHHYLLQAIPAIVRRVPDAHFLWVGDGPLLDDLRWQMQALDIQAPRLILTGWYADIQQLLAAADLFVLPSLREGFPLVVLEALAAGVPVIATRVGGTPEAIEDGVSGRLVEPHNSAALVAAIVEALTQPDLMQRWRTEGRRFDCLFSAVRMARETVALYEAVQTPHSQYEARALAQVALTHTHTASV